MDLFLCNKSGLAFCNKRKLYRTTPPKVELVSERDETD